MASKDWTGASFLETEDKIGTCASTICLFRRRDRAGFEVGVCFGLVLRDLRINCHGCFDLILTRMWTLADTAQAVR